MPSKGGERPEVVYCGDDAEPFGLLVAQLAYEMEPAPELGYRFLRP